MDLKEILFGWIWLDIWIEYKRWKIINCQNLFSIVFNYEKQNVDTIIPTKYNNTVGILGNKEINFDSNFININHVKYNLLWEAEFE